MGVMRGNFVMPLLAALIACGLAVGGAVAFASGGFWALLGGGAVALGLGAWLGARLQDSLKRVRLRLPTETSSDALKNPFASHPLPEFRALGERLRETEEKIALIFASQRDFTAHAAHELRTPLAALRLTGESALRAGKTEGYEEAIGGMLEEAERVGRVIEQLLLLARAESGQLPVRSRTVTVGELVGPVLETLRVLAESKGQSVVGPEDPEVIVWADADLFRIVLENLLANAIQHSPPGSTIEIQARRLERGGVAVEVVDDGPGLMPDEEEKVFLRFVRGRGAPSGGTGLGLPMARWAAEAFGGKLVFERRLGSGSVFRILCPESEWDHFENPPAGEAPEISAAWAAGAAPAQLLARLGSRRTGLDADEAEARRAVCGANSLRSEEALSAAGHLWRAVCTPFNGVLAVSIVLSLLLGEAGPAVVMGCMVVLGTGLRFLQEWRSRVAASRLESLIALRTRVARPDEGAPFEVRVDELVPGDVVHLQTGDMVPGDLRLLSADGLQVSEATFTGESFPVSKQTGPALDADADAGANNLCFLGTHVVMGAATGLIYATGRNTRLGKMSGRAARTRRAGPFERGVSQVSVALLGVMAVILPTVFLLNGVLKGNWTEALLFGLAAAIGLTPELLPMIVNFNLARAATLLARFGVLVRSLPSVHDLGSMDILCLDKTGTLTLDQPEFAGAFPAKGESDHELLAAAAINSMLQLSARGSLDEAIEREWHLRGPKPARLAQAKAGEVPFDHERGRVSVVVLEPNDKRGLLVCKGAPEKILDVCDSVEGGGRGSLTPQLREDLLGRLAELLAGGHRVLGVAKKYLGREETSEPTSLLEEGMEFLGFVAFRDPVREDSAETLRELRESGLQLRLLTGDHPEVAKAVGHSTGFRTERILTGAEVAALDDALLAQQVGVVEIFARLSPVDKARVVAACRAAGGGDHRVGYVGDGANDAQALREADVGIAGEGAADLSREASDVMLTSPGLAALPLAVTSGRTAFANMLKYIKITASSNFGNALSVVLASFLLPFLPMRAVQLLAQNLLYDIAQFLMPWDRVDASFTAKPRAWSADSILRFMFVFGPLSCVFDLLTFAMLWWGFGVGASGNTELFHTGWFTVGLLTQLVIVLVLRTERSPFFRHPAAFPVLIATLLAAAVGLVLPYSELSSALGFVALPVSFYAWVAAVLVGYILSAEWVKRRYLHRTGQWL
jgi:Mg2+-importing ATPase